MNNLFKPSWWVQMVMSTIMTMVFIYLIKATCSKVNVPVLSTIAGAV